MDTLEQKLNGLIEELTEDKKTVIRSRLNDLASVYPFNEYEYIISSLMGFGKITLDDYYQIRDDYISRNIYLYIFEIASLRGFGERWAQGELMSLEPDFVKPTKKLDVNYSGQYDIALKYKGDFIKIEVKASRAVDEESEEPLYVKALSYGSAQSFTMNFQQIKPACADVFIWIAVWRDAIKYWVISSTEVESNKHYSDKQHQGNTGEGQLHIKDNNIKEFVQYECHPKNLKQVVIETYERQKTSNSC